MTTRYTGNRTRIRRDINTWREDRVAETMRCGKQGGQTFEGADRYWERDAKTVEESTRSAAESVHETPINNDTSNFTKDDGFLHGKKKRRSDKGQSEVDGYIGGIEQDMMGRNV